MLKKEDEIEDQRIEKKKIKDYEGKLEKQKK